jgi:hypothetical protein
MVIVGSEHNEGLGVIGVVEVRPIVPVDITIPSRPSKEGTCLS